MREAMSVERKPARPSRARRWRRVLIGLPLAVLVAGLLLPERVHMPVQGARARDWNPRSFWFEPWGVSGVHKGIDIFAPTGTPAVADVDGVVVFAGRFGIGGNVVALLGPKWRVHYYAHLDSSRVTPGALVSAGQVIGAVGASGNAAGKPPHLHFAVISLLPLPWRATSATQGWRRMFYLDPGPMLSSAGGG